MQSAPGMSSISPATERQGIVQISPPASTPPPPPPPPPPLMLPGLGDYVADRGGPRKMRMRRYFWKTIPEEKVRGQANLWTQNTVMSQYHINVQKVKELFVQNCQENATAMPLRGGKVKGSTKEKVSILNLKRAMNIEIFLKQFKRSSETVVDDIRHGDSDTYGAELLRELRKLLPDTEEVKKLRSYQGNASSLSLADSFIYRLIQLPCYTVRVESMLLKEEFPELCEAIKRDIRILHSATKELMSCEELHTVLHLLLQAGNILNSGGHSGNAVGFKLSSLLSLSNIKAIRDEMNLLHFIAMEAQRKDEQLLQFPLKLTHIPAAARISIKGMDTEMQFLMARTMSVEEGIQRDAELGQQMNDFLQAAASFLSLLRARRQQLQEDVSKLIDFFCEERDTFKLDYCFGVFYTFCCKFTAAVKENMEWEVKKAHKLERQRWHLWAGNKKVGASFRLCSSSKADMSAAVSGFHSAGLLINQKSAPPSAQSNTLSPIEQTGSLCYLQKSSSTSIAAEHEVKAMIPDSKERGGGGSVKPEPEDPACNIQQTQQHFEGEMQTQLSMQQNIYEAHTTATYPKCDASHNPAGGGSSTKKHSFDWNQESSNNISNMYSSRPVQSDQNETYVHKTANTVLTMSHMEFNHNSSLHQHHHDTVIINNLEKEGDDRSVIQISQMGNSEEYGRSLSSTQKQEKDHCWSNSQEGKQQASFALATHMLSGPQPASENPVLPIIILPVPVSHCDDSSFQKCFSKQQPAAKEVPGLTIDDTEGGKETDNHGRGAETTIIETKTLDPIPQQSADDNSPSCHMTNAKKNKKAASNNEQTEQTTSSKSSANNTTASTTRAVARKPKVSQPCNKSKPVHTPTSFKNQGMRCVFPISKISREGMLSLGKCPEKKLGHQQKPPSTAVINNAPLRHGERPSGTPLSQRSIVHKTQETDQNQDLQRKLTLCNLLIKPRPQQEMCHSTKPALNQEGVSVTSPSAPRHKTSSSFRCVNASFVRPVPPNSINTGTNSGHKSSFKTTTSSTSALPKTSLPLTRTGLFRVSTSSSSLQTKSQTIRVSPRSPLHESTPTPPKGYRKIDSSGSFSEIFTQVRDSAKTEPSGRKQLVRGRRREVSGHIPKKMTETTKNCQAFK